MQIAFFVKIKYPMEDPTHLFFESVKLGHFVHNHWDCSFHAVAVFGQGINFPRCILWDCHLLVLLFWENSFWLIFQNRQCTPLKKSLKKGWKKVVWEFFSDLPILSQIIDLATLTVASFLLRRKVAKIEELSIPTNF